MEIFLAQCSQLFASGSSPLLLTVVVAGLVGSLSHCSAMCAPLVASQMLTLQQQGRSQRLMALYHAGRVLTYVFLGVVAMLFSQWIFSGALRHYSSYLLLLAGVTFIISAALPRTTHHGCAHQSAFVARLMQLIPHPSLAYLLRGVLMGFMPCGMVVAVLLMVATSPNVAHAALAMTLFGLSTIPVLQLTGFGALRIAARYPQFSARAGRGVMALNGLFLCGLGLNLVRVY